MPQCCMQSGGLLCDMEKQIDFMVTTQTQNTCLWWLRLDCLANHLPRNGGFRFLAGHLDVVGQKYG